MKGRKLLNHDKLEFVVKLIKEGKSTYIIHETLKKMGVNDLGYTTIDNFKKIMLDESIRRYLVENIHQLNETDQEKLKKLIPGLREEIEENRKLVVKEVKKEKEKIAKKNLEEKTEFNEEKIEKFGKKEILQRKNKDKPKSTSKKNKSIKTPSVTSVKITDKELDILQMRDKAIENMKTGIQVLDRIIQRANKLNIDFVELESLIRAEKNYVTLNMLALSDLKVKYLKVANESIAIQNRMFTDETNRLIALANERREQTIAKNNEESIFQRIQRDEERFIEAEYKRK